MSSKIRRFRAEWFALIAIQIGVALALVGTLYREHVATTTSEGERLEAAARVVDDNLVRQFEAANNALGGFRREMRGIDAVATPAVLVDKLKLLSDAMPGIGAMLVLDASGRVIASSRSRLTGMDFGQRDYFNVARLHPDPAVLYVSPPFQGTLGSYLIILSRVLTDDRGRFAGIIAATLDPDYFGVVLRSVLYSPDMRTALIHQDGKVFLHMPATGARPEPQNSASAALLAGHRRAGNIATLTVGLTVPNEDERIVAMRTIDRPDLHFDKPMVVAVGRSLSVLQAPWRAKAWQYAALLATLVVGSSLYLRLNQRRMKTFSLLERAVEKEHKAGAERVELALRGADLGLWDLQLPTNRFVVNARERELLGYSGDHELPQGPAWRDLIHPDDRALVDASILPHLRGEAPSYACEHRMRHRDGRYLWVSCRAMIVDRDPEGAPTRIVGTHLDITESKLAEERLVLATSMLRDSEEELRLLTDHVPGLVSQLDLDQRFCFANRTYADWLHMEPSTLIGRSLLEVYGAAAYESFRHHIECAMNGAKVVYERGLPTPNGLRHVAFTLVPQFGRDGAVKGLYTLATDVTERHEAGLLRARSEERLSLALEASNLALFDSDLVAGTTYHSAQAEAMRGEPPVEITAPSVELQRHVHPEDLAPLLSHMQDAVTGRTPVYHTEFRLRRNDGNWLWVRARGRVVERDAEGRALRLAGTYADVNDRRLAEERLRRLAELDTLTGLPNRALFLDRLRQAMVRAARGKPMALLFLDIDHFKSINDTLGHEAGDKLLMIFAQRMQGAVRESDTVARLGGDEFTIILESLRGLDDARMLAAKLVAALRQPVVLADHRLEVTASIGLTLCVRGESDDAALLRRADLALYEAKRRGRNGYWCAEFNAAAAAVEAAAID